MGTTIDSLDIEISASVKNDRSISTLITRLNTINQSLVAINGNNLPLFSKNMENLAASMQGFSNIQTNGFTRVVSNLKSLEKIDNATFIGITSGISGLSNSLNGITENKNLSQISELAKSFRQFGYKSVQSAITNMPLLANSLMKLMSTLSHAPTVNTNLIQMTNALANLAKQGSRAGYATRSLNSSLKSANATAKESTRTWKGLASSFGKFYASMFLVIRGFKAIGRSIKSSMDYVEVLNYFNASMEQVVSKADLSSWEDLGYESAQAYADSFEKTALTLFEKMSGFTVGENGMLLSTDATNLGINPTTLMNYQAQFMQMASSMGVTSQYASKLSIALTEIGADLASVKNMEFKDVWDDMASGLAGMSRTLDKYGINIRDVNLQQELYNLGIETSVENLNQNEKALLRTIVLLNNSRFAWGDLADTINQPANQLRLLQANFSNLSRTIGNIFLPIVAKMLPYVNAATIVLQRMVQALVNILGFNDFEWGGSSISNDLLSDVLDVGDALDDASGKAKKLKQNLLGIDELNIISEDSNGSDGSDILDNIGLLETAFDNAFSEYQKAWDAAFEIANQRAKDISDAIIEQARRAVKNISEGYSNAYVADDQKLKENTSKIKKSILDIIQDKEVQKALEKYSDQVQKTYGSIIGSIASIGTSASVGISGGVSDALSELEEFNKSKIVGILNNLTNLQGTFEKISDGAAKVGKAFESDGYREIVKVFTEIGDIALLSRIEKLTGVFSDWMNYFSSPFTDNAEKFSLVLEDIFDIVSYIFKPLDKLLSLISRNSKEYEDSWIHKLFVGITDFNSSNVGSVLDKLHERLSLIKAILNPNDNLDFWIENVDKLTKAVEIFLIPIQNVLNIIADLGQALGILDEDTANALRNFSSNTKKEMGIVFSEMGNSKKGTDDLSNSVGDLDEKTKKLLEKNNQTFKIETEPTPLKTFGSFLWDVVSGLRELFGFNGKELSISSSGDSLSVQGYAVGGFPEDGLFMANHNELVGQFSNGKTAVANNQQITEGIKQAVIEGMMEVVMATNSNGNGGTVEIPIYLDGREVGRGTADNIGELIRNGQLKPSWI